MKDFNIIDTAGRAYFTVWQERAYLFRLMVFPVLIKLACFIFALSAGFDDHLLRLTLCLVPAYLAEGWMIAHFVRTLSLGQRWPFRPTGDMTEDMAQIKVRARGVMGGAVAYTLINMLIGGYLAMMMHIMPFNVAPEEVNPAFAFLGLFLVAFSVFAFRFIWAHIPLSLNVPIRDVLMLLQQRGLTFRFIGVWALCFVPVMAAMMFVISFYVSIMGGGDAEAVSQFGAVILRVVFDTAKVIACTAGMTFCILHLMSERR